MITIITIIRPITFDFAEIETENRTATYLIGRCMCLCAFVLIALDWKT